METQANSELNILLLGSYIENENLSGPEKYAKRICSGLERTQKVTFVTYFESGGFSLWTKLFCSQRIEGSKIIRLGLLRLFIHLLGNNYDIIHTVTYNRFAILAYFLSHRAKRIYTAHGIIKKEDDAKQRLSFFYKLKNRIAEKIFLEKSDLIITISPYISKEITSYYPKSTSNYRSIAPGIDESFLRYNKSAAALHDPVRVLFLGGFNDREKAALCIIQQLLHTISGVKITCVGFSNVLQNVDDVIYIDRTRTEDWTEILFAQDVFISPFSGETFSIASLEAMALGKVVIADVNSGVASVIQHGINGFVFDSSEAAGITGIVQLIMSKSLDIEQISKNAVTSVQDMSWDKSARKHYETYTEVKASST